MGVLSASKVGLLGGSLRPFTKVPCVCACHQMQRHVGLSCTNRVDEAQSVGPAADLTDCKSMRYVLPSS